MTGFAWLQLGAGLALVGAGWLIPRHTAARWGALAALLLDLAPLALGAALLALATGRPLFAGVIVLALGAGFALADKTMRETLREPIVFSEAVELPQVFTHPHLYLPFAGPGLVLGGAGLAVAIALGLLVVEPPLWAPQPVAAFAAVMLIAAAVWLFSREPGLGFAARRLRRLRPSGEPFADAATLGPFAMLIAHAAIARAERAERHARLAAPAVLSTRPGPAVPIVLVQCESFFDARRLSPLIPRDLLPGYDAAMASARQYGRIEVPGWGANTMRAEFSVLTGIPESELGYDRFNPYYALARKPIRSQVWRLRQAGYRTICLHPFDPRFFRRDLAMPALGFDEFLAGEALSSPHRPPYCSDPELAGHILRILDANGPRTLIFAITMGNHGPWLPNGDPINPSIAGLFEAGSVPQGQELLRYLDGLRRSDRMLELLTAGLTARRSPAVLGFYGDHLPSFGKAFAHFAFDEPHSDYLIWPGLEAAPRRVDLPAAALGRTIVDLVLDERFGSGAAAQFGAAAG